MSTPSYPTLPRMDSSLFFPDLINFHMQNNPTLPMWIYANDQGITEISFLEFGRAAHRIAHALRPERIGDDGQVVMLIANSDTILHQAVVAGLTIAGLVPFPVSPRNSAAAVIDMMKKVKCSRIVTLMHAHQSLIDSICKEGSLAFTLDEIPTVSYAFPKLGCEVGTDFFIPYPPLVSRPDPNVTSIYIHSSGSTGYPKPIPQSYKVQVQWMVHMTSAFFGIPTPGDRACAAALPPFHAFGLAIADSQTLPIMPTSDNILDTIRRTNCKILMTVPTFLEQWAASTEAIESLSKLQRVVYGGGPLARKIGDILWAGGVNIGVAYGGTEFGCPVSFRDREEIEDGEWMWMRFSEDIQVRWAPQGDGTYEFQVLTTENNQVSIENLPDVKGYATSDLFIKHPTKDLWKIIGRSDDVITLASGEKMVPVQMEGIIISSPLIQSVVMFGRGKNQAGILVEPHPEYALDTREYSAIDAFKNSIWPIIEEANKIAPEFGRIFKEMILVTDSKHPVIRTPKGTVERKATIKVYETQINALYSEVEASRKHLNSLTGPSAWTTDGVLVWLAAHANTISKGRNLDLDADLFGQGFDSLSVTYTRNKVVNALLQASDSHVRDAASLVSLNIVFENPTLRLLAARISDLVSEHRILGNMDRKQRHIAAMNAMIDKYSVGLPGLLVADSMKNGVTSYPTGNIILLTGSTGGLGSFLLFQLLENPRVERVYAFNRPSSMASIEERQKSAFVDKAIPVEMLNSEKLVYVEADASRDECGIPSELYDEIRNSVTIIIHNAWRLDFNLSLVSFEPNVKATRNLINLALDSKHRSSLRFIFTSSLGTANSWDRTKGAFPEELQLDPSTAVGSGYGESKYVCERLIAKSGLRATSLRLGQIAGGPNGSWATTDWIPIIVKSSIALGSLPSSLGVVSWMRAEDAASAVLDVAFTDSALQCLNILNPQCPGWTDIMSFIRDEILDQKPFYRDCLPFVPFFEWVINLEKRAENASPEDLVCIPAIKILAFLSTIARSDDELTQTDRCGSVSEAGGFPDFSMAKAQCISNSVLNMRPVGELEARAWVRYWIMKGFL